MNRFYSFALIVATTVFGYVLYKQKDIGQININLGEFNIETSLLVFGAAFIALLFSVLLLLRTIEYFNKNLSALASYFKYYFSEKSKYALSDSLLDIAEGRYAKAEKRLLDETANFTDSFPLYLAAATAAQHQKAYDRRDEYFQLAREASGADKPKTEIAIGLIKAEFHLANNQPEQAINILTSLENVSPKHVQVLALLSEAYLRLSRWDQLRELTNKLYKYKALPEDALHVLEIETWHGLIKDNSSLDKEVFLCGLWDEMPAHLRTSNELITFYVCALQRIKQDEIAAQLLQHSLSHSWQDSLVILYAELDIPANDKQLEIAEAWLIQHPDNVHLLLALGKMCIKLGLWGKARSYLEASFSICPLVETCLRLATLLEEQIGETEMAQDYYRKGLYLSVDKTVPTIIKNNGLQKELTPGVSEAKESESGEPEPTKSEPRLKIVSPK